MFSKEERSSFAYWFAHWCAYQMTALNLKAWKPKYLLHDIEKPWLMLLFKGDYEKVQKFHRKHNAHHAEYWLINGKGDFEAMAIDRECSRFTKLAGQLNAAETLEMECCKMLANGIPIDKISMFHSLMYEKLVDLGIVDRKINDYPKYIRKFKQIENKLKNDNCK